MGEQKGGVVHSVTVSPMESSDSSSKCCDECKTNAFKYKCPGCSVRSCSLPCVKAHKQRTGCTGKRQQKTEFVPLSKFDDSLILSDYNMLEDVKRIADSAKRRRMQLFGDYFHGLPPPLKNLLKAAKSRRTTLLFLPKGMSKRETNKTFIQKRVISWTIEWHFHSTDIKMIDHGVDENSNIYSAIENRLKPGPRNHPLKQFCLEPVESLKFFIRKHPKQRRSPFRELDIHTPIRQQLANLVIIEYPAIHVFLPSHSINFEVIKDIVTQRVQPKTEPVKESQPVPEGVFFKEEEIKDHDSADPHVLDLMDQSTSHTETTVDIHKPLDSTNNDSEHGAVDLMEFEFDPELIDIYSNLISETNPDDYFDFDGVPCNVEEEKGEVGVVREDLEEGEIVESD